MSNVPCPQWAKEMISQLQQVEQYLGNLPRDDKWNSDFLGNVSKRTFAKDEAVFDDEKAELLFRKIVHSLTHEGFTQTEIASFINQGMTAQPRIKYCDETEVAEAQKTSAQTK